MFSLPITRLRMKSNINIVQKFTAEVASAIPKPCQRCAKISLAMLLIVMFVKGVIQQDMHPLVPYVLFQFHTNYSRILVWTLLLVYLGVRVMMQSAW